MYYVCIYIFLYICVCPAKNVSIKSKIFLLLLFVSPWCTVMQQIESTVTHYWVFLCRDFVIVGPEALNLIVVPIARLLPTCTTWTAATGSNMSANPASTSLTNRRDGPIYQLKMATWHECHGCHMQHFNSHRMWDRSQVKPRPQVRHPAAQNRRRLRRFLIGLWHSAYRNRLPPPTTIFPLSLCECKCQLLSSSPTLTAR